MRNRAVRPPLPCRARLALGPIFSCIWVLSQYLQSEGVRREIHDALNVIESWNGANTFIFYGRSGRSRRISWMSRRCRFCACI